MGTERDTDLAKELGTELGTDRDTYVQVEV